MGMTQELIAAHTNGLKSSIHALEVQVTILKQLLGGAPKAGKVSAATESDEDETTADEEEDDDFSSTRKAATKAAAKKVAASFDDEDEEEAASDDAPEADEEEEELAPKKRGRPRKTSFDEEDEEEEKPTPKKAKKLTADDVNDACKLRAKRNGGGKDGRNEVLAILKKKFKVTSVMDLKEDQYAKVIAAMQE